NRRPVIVLVVVLVLGVYEPERLRGRRRGRLMGSWSRCMRKRETLLFMNRTHLERRSPHPGPLPSDGRGRVVRSLFGNRTLVRGSWSRCMRGGETPLFMNRTHLQRRNRENGLSSTTLDKQ